MTGKNQLWMLGGALVVGAFAVVLMAASASATQTGDTYGGSGDWNIFNPTTVTGETVTVSGNINVYSTFTVSATTIQFTLDNRAFNVFASTGELTMSPGSGTTLV